MICAAAVNAALRKCSTGRHRIWLIWRNWEMKITLSNGDTYNIHVPRDTKSTTRPCVSASAYFCFGCRTKQKTIKKHKNGQFNRQITKRKYIHIVYTSVYPIHRCRNINFNFIFNGFWPHAQTAAPRIHFGVHIVRMHASLIPAATCDTRSLRSSEMPLPQAIYWLIQWKIDFYRFHSILATTRHSYLWAEQWKRQNKNFRIKQCANALTRSKCKKFSSLFSAKMWKIKLIDHESHVHMSASRPHNALHRLLGRYLFCFWFRCVGNRSPCSIPKLLLYILWIGVVVAV